MPTITFEGVSVHHPGAPAPILEGINATLCEQRIGIIGANGSGKSTLARLINGLGTPTAGRVVVDGMDVGKNGAKVRRKVGFIFADAENQIIMPQVREDIAFSLRRSGLSRHDKTIAVDEALRRFELHAHQDQSPHTLSGGQKQLLALAAVLVTNPSIIVADEPTTLLDLRNRLRIRREFAALRQQLIVVTHDLDLIADFDRVIFIDDGRIRDDGPPHRVIPTYIELMESRPL